MAWIRIDDHFDEHPKMQRVGPLAWGFWLAGLAYCNRNLTDGFIPWNKARTLCSFEVVEDDGEVWGLSRVSGMSGADMTADWLVGLLIDAGLWEEVRNEKGRVEGYRVHDYPEYQPLKAQIEKEREATRQRVEAHRNKKNGRFGGNDDVTPLPQRYNGVSNDDVTPAPNPNPKKQPSVGADAPAGSNSSRKESENEAHRLVRALSERTGVPVTSWPKSTKQANQLLAAKCDQSELMAMVDWFEADPFFAEKGFDLGMAVNQLERFRQSKRTRAATVSRRGVPA